MAEAPLRPAERLAGCLIGQAVGDALGFPVEGESPETCRRYVAEVLQAGRAGEVGRPPFPFGQYTDDTQLAREFVASHAERGGFDPADYGQRIAAIFVEGRIVGRGRTTEAAALRLAAGVPWHEAGTPAPSAGNGGAMRAGPAGVLHGEAPEGLVRVAADQARITHADPRAVAGAVAIAGATALTGRPGLVDAEATAGTLAEWVDSIEPRMAAPLRRLPGWLRLAPEAAAEVIAAEGYEPGEAAPWAGISPFVTPSVLWALYAALRTPDDYWEAVCTAILPGGDVDTTAAMAGAIVGARLGPAAVPSGLAQRVNDRGEWDAAALRGLAERAVAARAP